LVLSGLSLVKDVFVMGRPVDDKAVEVMRFEAVLAVGLQYPGRPLPIILLN